MYRTIAVVASAMGAALAIGQEGEPVPRVLVVPLENQLIHPVTARFLNRALHQAGQRKYECVILVLNTPGGRMDSTRHIVKDILASSTPVVVYVAPSGARAGFAGLFITLAANVAAMAPGTKLGAAPRPGMPNVPPARADDPGNRHPPAARADNDSSDPQSWACALAEQRGRNGEWAGAAVRDGTSTAAPQALAEKVVDLLATDLDDLLTQLDGRKIKIAGETIVLNTHGAVVDRFEMSLPERLLCLLANPTLAYFLLLLGFAGLMFEIAHPGTWIPGAFGVTCLLLAILAAQLLPINYAGLALIVLGLLLIVLEVKVQSYAILTAGGAGCMLVGSALLIEPVDGVEPVSWLVVAPVSLALALIAVLVLRNIVRINQMKVQTGMEGLIGAVAHVKGDMNREGYVYVAGALWKARCEQPLQDGETVRVQGYDGLTLHVKPIG